MHLATLARRGYVTAPTPLEYLPRLTKSLGNKVRIYMKRDDLLPGAGGGNKTRKLDFIMAQAVKNHIDAVITCGAPQSNHCRLTLSWAKKEGMECHLVLQERVPGSYRKDASGNNLLYHLLGVDSITLVKEGENREAVMERVASQLREKGKNPLVIPAGASNALGASGYAVCANEILEQAYQQQIGIDAVFAPSGSCGTQAGLAVGFQSANANFPVYGVNVSRGNEAQVPKVQALADDLADFLEVPRISQDLCLNLDEYVGPGYSVPTEGMVEAVRMTAETEAILLDPVYSGKAMAGLIDCVRKGMFRDGSSIVFVHTGGSPALYAYKDTFL